MDKRQRIALLVFCSLLVLLLAVFFWPFLKAEIIAPLALSAWLFLRIFVLSVDQKVYWAILILVGLFLTLRRFFPVISLPAAPEPPEGNGTLSRAYLWRGDILFGEQDQASRQTIRREITKLIVSIYSSRLHGSAYLDGYEPLKQKQIALPGGVYEFLFGQEPEAAGTGLPKLLRSLRDKATSQMRRWSGQERRDYYQAVDELLTFMESELEITNDND